MARTRSSSPSPSALEGSLATSPDDEVSLVELWGVLARRKVLILTVLLVSLLTAGFFVYFTPRTYESRAVLQIGRVTQMAQIGQVVQMTQIEPPATFVKRVMVQHGADNGGTESGNADSFIQAAFAEKDTNLVSIVARGPSPDAVQEYLTRVIGKLIDDHKNLFDGVRNELQNSLHIMQVRGHGINQAIATNEKEMGILVRQPTGANTITTMGAYLIASERSKLLEQRLLVEQKQTELRMAMSELQSSPTTLLKTPTLPADPVKPRPLLYFLLASGIGLAMGIFIAYVMEFARRAVRPPE